MLKMLQTKPNPTKPTYLGLALNCHVTFLTSFPQLQLKLTLATLQFRPVKCITNRTLCESMTQQQQSVRVAAHVPWQCQSPGSLQVATLSLPGEHCMLLCTLHRVCSTLQEFTIPYLHSPLHYLAHSPWQPVCLPHQFLTDMWTMLCLVAGDWYLKRGIGGHYCIQLLGVHRWNILYSSLFCPETQVKPFPLQLHQQEKSTHPVSCRNF